MNIRCIILLIGVFSTSFLRKFFWQSLNNFVKKCFFIVFFYIVFNCIVVPCGFLFFVIYGTMSSQKVMQPVSVETKCSDKISNNDIKMYLKRYRGTSRVKTTSIKGKFFIFLTTSDRYCWDLPVCREKHCSHSHIVGFCILDMSLESKPWWVESAT